MSFQWNVTKVYEKNWLSEKRIIINRGGTRSSKTYSLCQLFVWWLMTGRIRKNDYIPRGVATIVRKYKTTVKATVQRDFEEILKEYKLYRLIEHNKTDRTYRYQGRMIRFIGADDEQKIRGYKSDILYCNEANEISVTKEWRALVLRTKGPIFLDFNPSSPYTWIKTELEDKRAFEKGDVETIISTYKDNPTLSQIQIDEIEYLQKVDPVAWRVYGLGEYGQVEGLVIPRITVIEKMPEGLKKQAAGLDFGFTHSATALTMCGVIEPNKIFIDVPIYGYGLTDRILKQKLKDFKIPRSYEIFADSAQPQSIRELQLGGFNVKAVKKFRDSINVGVARMRELEWHVTARSQGLIKEQQLYKFKQNQAGEWLNEPIDEWNHAMDAVRYYVLSKIRSKRMPYRRKSRSA